MGRGVKHEFDRRFRVGISARRHRARLTVYAEYVPRRPLVLGFEIENSVQPVADHFEDILGMVEIGSGTMPENLPKPESSIQQIESAKKKLEKKKP